MSGNRRGMPGELTVLYDASCRVCRSARDWLNGQPKYVSLRFVAAGSPRAKRLFPTLDHEATLRDITVIDNVGNVYRGAKAWVMCLWATREHRARAIALTTPALWPMAKRFIAWVSTNRGSLGGVGELVLGTGR